MSSTSSAPVYVAPTYIPATQLHALLLDPKTAATTLIVDVRDEDFVGGNIAGALNVPSEELRDSFHKIQAAAKDKHLVVFHCMKSQMRGPKCARMVAEKKFESFPPIQILENGFEGWVRYVSRIEGLTPEVKEKLIAAYSKDHHGYNI